MSCSRSCEIFALLSFLQFGESLGTASNKQEDLMMNSEKPRIRTRNELRKMKCQKCLSNTIFQKVSQENNRLEKQDRQIEHYRRTSFVGVLPLFGRFEADFECKSDSDDI